MVSSLLGSRGFSVRFIAAIIFLFRRRGPVCMGKMFLHLTPERPVARTRGLPYPSHAPKNSSMLPSLALSEEDSTRLGRLYWDRPSPGKKSFRRFTVTGIVFCCEGAISFLDHDACVGLSCCRGAQISGRGCRGLRLSRQVQVGRGCGVSSAQHRQFDR